MGMKATIYIPDEKYKLYENARDQLGDSISVTFLRCLERQLEIQRLSMKSIVVKVVDGNRTFKRRFQGRWLIGGEFPGEMFNWTGPEETSHADNFRGYSVALTQADRIVVIEHFEPWNEMRVYDDHQNFRNGTDPSGRGYPESLIAAVLEKLEVDIVEDLDI